MSITKLTRTPGAVTSPVADWVRPSDWLTLPTPAVGAQVIYGIVAVYPHNVNNVAFSVAGAYTVDWGDGTVTNYGNGIVATRNIQWSAVSAATTTSEGFRQALVTITPQAGNSMTGINLAQTPGGFSTPFINQWRDVVIQAPLCTSFSFSSTNSRNGARMLTWLGTAGITSLQTALQSSFLRTVVGTQWTSTATNFQGMFDSCAWLQSIPAIDTSGGTNFSQMFIGCSVLRTVPFLNTANGTTFQQMFMNCVRLTSVPLFDTSKGTTCNALFSGCSLLQSVPNFSTGSCTDFSSMFQLCSLLRTAPTLDTSKGVLFASMFNGCGYLLTVPNYVTSLGTNFTTMFQACACLVTAPALDVSNGITFTSMFSNCIALDSIPTYASAKGTNFQNFANGCSALRSIDLDCSGAPSSVSMQTITQGGNGNLRNILLRGLKFAPTSMQFAGQGLSAQALNDLYTALGTATGAQTINVAGNPGSGSSTPSIATAKGWTIVGG